MADLVRPAGISDTTWDQLQALARTDEAGATAATAIANRVATAVKAGVNPDTFVTDAIRTRYNTITGGSRPLASGVFGNVLPPEARALLSTGNSINMGDGDARASLVRGIESYVGPRAA